MSQLLTTFNSPTRRASAGGGSGDFTSLTADSVYGLFYANNTNNVYQDYAGTTPVTGTGQAVMRWNAAESNSGSAFCGTTNASFAVTYIDNVTGLGLKGPVFSDRLNSGTALGITPWRVTFGMQFELQNTDQWYLGFNGAVGCGIWFYTTSLLRVRFYNNSSYTTINVSAFNLTDGNKHTIVMDCGVTYNLRIWIDGTIAYDGAYAAAPSLDATGSMGFGLLRSDIYGTSNAITNSWFCMAKTEANNRDATEGEITDLIAKLEANV